MNGINRVSQRVVCVHPALIECFKHGRLFAPKIGDSYTVEAFETMIVPASAGGPYDVPGIHLVGQPGVGACGCYDFFNTRRPWPLMLFKPVDERKTDISAIVEATDFNPASSDQKIFEKSFAPGA